MENLNPLFDGGSIESHITKGGIDWRFMMPKDKKTERSDKVIAPPMASDSSIKLPAKDTGKDGIPSKSIPSVSAGGNPGTEGTASQPLASVQGYKGFLTPSDEKVLMTTTTSSYIGMDNAALLYYLPGYCPYMTECVGIDGKQAYTSEYLQQPCTYSLETFPYTAATPRSSSMISAKSPSGTGKSNALNICKTNSDHSSKTSALPLHSKIQQYAPQYSQPLYQNQSNSLKKLGSGLQSSSLMKGFQPAGKFSSYNQNPGVRTRFRPVNNHRNIAVWNSHHRYNMSRECVGRDGDTQARIELTCGPRAGNGNNSTKPPTECASVVTRDEYNLTEFQTEYNNAKFFVIKSFSEDNIHKSIKYNVWSSTINGNKKLDAVFSEADATASETGTECPVFLFFSVNGSAQFVGIAEMIGPVDSSRNMDFWQLQKWNGFFPVKWHIIKDVPNTLLRHITLENNENRAVTVSRDTQEIGLRQGLEMLTIFKNYSEKASILDDFDFYENRERTLRAKKTVQPAAQKNGTKNDY